jgi:hypothetical protein
VESAKTLHKCEHRVLSTERLSGGLRHAPEIASRSLGK